MHQTIWADYQLMIYWLFIITSPQHFKCTLSLGKDLKCTGNFLNVSALFLALPGHLNEQLLPQYPLSQWHFLCIYWPNSDWWLWVTFWKSSTFCDLWLHVTFWKFSKRYELKMSVIWELQNIMSDHKSWNVRKLIQLLVYYLNNAA